MEFLLTHAPPTVDFLHDPFPFTDNQLFRATVGSAVKTEGSKYPMQFALGWHGLVSSSHILG